MVSKFFSCSDSDTLRVGRAQLAVPRGAMTHGRTLSITPLRRGEIPPLPTGLVNVTGGEDADTVVGYRFCPMATISSIAQRLSPFPMTAH